jgi:diguanylate cyclase (GGDEF)-like protein
MDVKHDSNLDLAIKVKSVRTFVKRVTITFVALLIFGSVAMRFFIYLPLNDALETSLVDNFNQMSTLNYSALQNSLNRGIEGSRSLTSRTMIKNAIEEYYNGQLDLEELKNYTQPKYYDGAKALQNIVLAQRYVDEKVVGEYLTPNVQLYSLDVEKFFTESQGQEPNIFIVDGRIYSVVISPIIGNEKILGYDKLIFDLTQQIKVLNTEFITTKILDQESYLDFSQGSRMVEKKGNAFIYSTEDTYYFTIAMQNNTYYISMQDKATLFAIIKQLSTRVFAAGLVTLLLFISIIYFYVVRYAKKELGNFEKRQIAFEKVATELSTDPLTKTGNRRNGNEDLQRSFADFRLNGFSPAIVTFDVDYLKNINDKYGHAAGDSVLREIVDALRNVIRSEDRLYRWGGDEFVGVFYGVKEDNAEYFAEKILESVSAITINSGGKQITPSISLGISFFKDKDIEFSDALKRADKAMYKSKAEGRNEANIK